MTVKWYVGDVYKPSDTVQHVTVSILHPTKCAKIMRLIGEKESQWKAVDLSKGHVICAGNMGAETYSNACHVRISNYNDTPMILLLSACIIMVFLKYFFKNRNNSYIHSSIFIISTLVIGKYS